jgi:hypothetical protein
MKIGDWLLCPKRGTREAAGHPRSGSDRGACWAWTPRPPRAMKIGHWLLHLRGHGSLSQAKRVDRVPCPRRLKRGTREAGAPAKRRGTREAGAPAKRVVDRGACWAWTPRPPRAMKIGDWLLHLRGHGSLSQAKRVDRVPCPRRLKRGTREAAGHPRSRGTREAGAPAERVAAKWTEYRVPAVSALFKELQRRVDRVASPPIFGSVLRFSSRRVEPCLHATTVPLSLSGRVITPIRSCT